MADYFVPGTCNTICDVTGFKVKRSECKVRWDGYVVIPEAWHPRQPQDFPPPIIPQTVVPDARPSPADDPVPLLNDGVIDFMDGAPMQYFEGSFIEYFEGDTQWQMI